MATIVLKLSGPLQSWGITSRFETRMTERYPSKSAIVGLIAASLGYRRNDDKQISVLNSLKIAVRIDQTGTILEIFTLQQNTKMMVRKIVYMSQRGIISKMPFL